MLRGLLWLRLLWPSRFRAHGRAPGIQGLCVRLGPPPAPNPRLSANPGCPDNSGRPGGLNPGSAATHGGAQAFSGLPRGFFAPSTVASHSGSQAFFGLPWGSCAPSAAAARPPSGPHRLSARFLWRAETWRALEWPATRYPGEPGPGDPRRNADKTLGLRLQRRATRRVRLILLTPGRRGLVPAPVASPAIFVVGLLCVGPPQPPLRHPQIRESLPHRLPNLHSPLAPPSPQQQR